MGLSKAKAWMEIRGALWLQSPAWLMGLPLCRTEIFHPVLEGKKCYYQDYQVLPVSALILQCDGLQMLLEIAPALL